MLLSEATASSILEIRRTFEAAFPRMNSAELFNLINILYQYQTADEQENANVRVLNNAGFIRTDSEKLTSLHVWYLMTKAKSPDKKGFYTDKQKAFIAKLLQKHCGQLIRHWIKTGKIQHNGRGQYFYVSKAEREAKRLAELDAKLAQGAADFRKQQEELNALHKTPEYQLQQRVEKNHGQLDFLNDLQ